MDTLIKIAFKVSPAQKEKIDARVFENGFDDLSVYLKVAALKTQKFTPSSAGMSEGEPSIELSFKATQAQIEKIEANWQESECKDLQSYLQYVSLHAVMTAVIEVRSSGGLDDMLSRIVKNKNLDIK